MTARRQASAASTEPAAGASRRQWLLLGAVAGLLVASAFGVISSTHACRELYAELQTLEATRWHLQEDYSRLLLEQSTWASHHRVEKVAADALGMRAPDLDAYKVVTP
jgi:cell division protein FtsL